MRTLAGARGLIVVIVLTAAGGAWLLAPGADPAAWSATRIDGCTTIDEPGRYVLGRALLDREADTSIRIAAGDVVLDGDGHRVDGVGAFGSAGVLVRAGGTRTLANVTVRDLRATGWDDAIRLVGVDRGAVVGTIAGDSRVGLSLVDASGTRVVDNVARGNRLYGIAVYEASAGNRFANNTAADNGLSGVHLVEAGVRNNTLVGTTATGNGFGVVLVEAGDNRLVGTVARGNDVAGVWLSAAVGNRIVGGRVENRFYGVYLADNSRSNVATGVTAVGNAVGVRLRSSDRNRVANNTVRDSTDTAILLISSDDNVVVDNRGSGNARGVSVVRSAGNRLANNSV